MPLNQTHYFLNSRFPAVIPSAAGNLFYQSSPQTIPQVRFLLFLFAFYLTRAGDRFQQTFACPRFFRKVREIVQKSRYHNETTI
jgi:hypothetical protein